MEDKKKQFVQRKKNIDSSKFKAGAYKERRVTIDETTRTEVTYYCNCGNCSDVAMHAITTMSVFNNHTCSQCGNKYFVRYISDPVRMGAFYIKGVRTSYLNASRINFTAKIKDGAFTIVRVNMIRDIELDIAQRKLIIHRNGELEYSYIDKEEELLSSDTSHKVMTRINTFFTQGMNSFGDGGNRDLFILHILKKASNLDEFSYDEIQKAITFFSGINSLRVLGSYNWYSQPIYAKAVNILAIIKDDIRPFIFLEKIVNANISVDFDSLIVREYSYSNRKYSYELIDRFDCLKPYRKKLHQCLSCPRDFLNVMREQNLTLDRRFLSEMDSVFTHGEAKKNKTMEFIKTSVENNVLNEVFPNNISKIMELVEEYNYDHETLINYLFVSCPMYQGLTSTREILNLLSDYLDMSVKMGFRFDKYPDSLKRSHDVKMVNYNVFRRESEGEDFTKAVREYGDLIFQNPLYQIVVPTSPKDLVREGSLLNHCIASYKDRVISGRSMIFFMRERANVKEPLVSIELSKTYNLIQSRGNHNRSTTDLEKEFINEWLVFVEDTLAHRRKEEKKNEVESFG